MRSYRRFYAIMTIGLVFMLLGAATTFVALGKDGKNKNKNKNQETVALETTVEVLPTLTLTPTTEPVVVAPVQQQPVEQVVEPV